MTFPEAIDWLSTKTIDDKVLFNKLLLSSMTIMNRAIVNDHTTSDTTKIECLKLSNELAHRVWNLIFELETGIDNKSEIELADNINFYQQQSGELSGHLTATFKSTLERFNKIKGE